MKTLANASMIFFLLASIGCSSWELIDYTPSNIMPEQALIKELRRILETQKKVPLDLDVDEERWTWTTFIATDKYASANTKTVYYDKIDKIELYQKKDTFSILLKDKNDQLLYQFLIQERDEATNIVNVLAALSEKAKWNRGV